jgi:hypothetical protein
MSALQVLLSQGKVLFPLVATLVLVGVCFYLMRKEE